MDDFDSLPVKQQTYRDLLLDFAELDYLYSTYTSKLEHISSYYLIHNTSVSLKFLRNTASALQKEISQHLSQIRQYKMLKPEKMNLNNAIRDKQKLYSDLHHYVQIIAALITATDWQSPSFNHSKIPQAGRLTGQITGTINDYKRDQHPDEKYYEDAFIDQYINGFQKLLVKSYLTNSGMSAFTTILLYLQAEKKISGTILFGKSMYFECKELISKIWPEFVEVDEHNTAEIIDKIKQHHPSVIFFDSLSNTKNTALPDLTTILSVIKKNNYPCTIIIDNTGLSLTWQPFKHMLNPGKISLIVFESLNKYHQFGLDHVTAGIVWMYGKQSWKLYHYRAYGGLNITDFSTLALPQPNAVMLNQRLMRYQRNASFFASTLQEYITDNKLKKFSCINYANLKHHPSYQWSKNLPFHGSSCVIDFTPEHANIKTYKSFMKNILLMAKKDNVQIIAGTSFGLNTTRIYLTALRATTFAQPFLRISVGTETYQEMQAVTQVFKKVMITMG